MSREVAELTGVLATVFTLLVFARNDGRREGRLGALESDVSRRLQEFGLTLERINLTLNANAVAQTEWTRWRGRTEERLEVMSSEVDRTRDRIHDDLVPKIQEALATAQHAVAGAR